MEVGDGLVEKKGKIGEESLSVLSGNWAGILVFFYSQQWAASLFSYLRRDTLSERAAIQSISNQGPSQVVAVFSLDTEASWRVQIKAVHWDTVLLTCFPLQGSFTIELLSNLRGHRGSDLRSSCRGVG